jgi:hypothetical protein
MEATAASVVVEEPLSQEQEQPITQPSAPLLEEGGHQEVDIIPMSQVDQTIFTVPVLERPKEDQFLSVLMHIDDQKPTSATFHLLFEWVQQQAS